MKIVALLFSKILSTIFSGYVLSVIWGWFIVDRFNLPLLNIVEALGIMLVVKFMTLQPDFYSLDNEDRDVRMAAFSWMLPIMALFIGWVYTLFM